MEKNIFVGGAIIDILVNKKKYRDYKNDSSRINYVNRVLLSIFEKLIGTKVGTTLIRDMTITPNNLWGEDFVEINDLGYSITNKVPPLGDDSKFLPLRLFHIDIIGISDTDLVGDNFFEIKDENYLITVSNGKLV